MEVMDKEVNSSKNTEYDGAALEKQVPIEVPQLVQKSTKGSQTPQEKTRREFWQGFTISLIGNSLAALIFLCQQDALFSIFTGEGLTQSQWGFGVVWFLANFLIAAYLYWRNKRVFQGVMAGYVLGFLITILAGAFITAVCYQL